MLDYGKAKREEQEIYSKEKRQEKELYLQEKREENEIYLKQKQMDFDHEYKMMEFAWKQNSTRQSVNEVHQNEHESSSTAKK